MSEATTEGKKAMNESATNEGRARGVSVNGTMVRNVTCPACGAEPGESCTTPVDGVETGWTHDRRVYAAIISEAREAS